MAGNLFIKAKNGEQLAAFAARTAASLGLTHLERRESSNYIGEEYFQSVALGIKVRFAANDEPGLEDHDFWIHLTADAPLEHRQYLDRTADPILDGMADLVARRLALGGEDVIRVPNIAVRDPDQTFIGYTVEPGDGVRTANRVRAYEVERPQ